MNERGSQLHATATGQITELIDLISGQSEAVLSLPCPGREKLGDGTIAALALHMSDNYLRIAGFVRADGQTRGARIGARQGRHTLPRLSLPRGHAPPATDQSDRSGGMHEDGYTAEHFDLHDLLERLSAAGDALAVLADLTDERLDTVPPNGSFRFCDGQRTLERVLAGLLNHQAHQIEAIKAALT
jgi:hypothetical protein